MASTAKSWSFGGSAQRRKQCNMRRPVRLTSTKAVILPTALATARTRSPAAHSVGSIGKGMFAQVLAMSGEMLRKAGPNISPRWAQDGSTWDWLGPRWAQPALNLGTDCLHTGKHCALCLPQFNIALPGFARRISAQSSHTIRQTSLLGRRPAARRKPLNLEGWNHEQGTLAEGSRWPPSTAELKTQASAVAKESNLDPSFFFFLNLDLGPGSKISALDPSFFLKILVLGSGSKTSALDPRKV